MSYRDGWAESSNLMQEVMCRCGHSLEDHHNPMVCLKRIFPIFTNHYCWENREDWPHFHAEECEHYGFNETGGMRLSEFTQRWEDHCRYFKLEGEEEE